MKYSLFFILFICFSLFAFSQQISFFKPSDTLNTIRRNTLVITEAAVGGLTLLALNQLWYADYKRSKFHTIDDNSEWLQMDKLGHVFSAYQL